MRACVRACMCACVCVPVDFYSMDTARNESVYKNRAKVTLFFVSFLITCMLRSILVVPVDGVSWQPF